jgi:hypothetical protein
VFARLPVRIGRSAEAEVVLFDASVSREHAIVEDGPQGIQIRDARSVNGLHKGPARVESIPVGAGVRCRLGTVEIELEPLSLEATLPLLAADWKRYDQRRSTADHVRYLLLGVAGWLLAVVVAPEFWSPWEKTRAVKLLWNTLGVLVGLPVLSFVLLGVLKVVGRRVRMADTLLALAQVAWVMPLAAIASLLLYYLTPLSTHALLTSVISLAAFVFAVVHVARVRRMGPARTFVLVWSAIAAAIFIGIGSVSGLAMRRMGMPRVEYNVQRPLGSVTGPARSHDTYFDEVRAASQDAARAAEEVRVKQDR